MREGENELQRKINAEKRNRKRDRESGDRYRGIQRLCEVARETVWVSNRGREKIIRNRDRQWQEKRQRERVCVKLERV